MCSFRDSFKTNLVVCGIHNVATTVSSPWPYELVTRVVIADGLSTAKGSCTQTFWRSLPQKAYYLGSLNFLIVYFVIISNNCNMDLFYRRNKTLTRRDDIGIVSLKVSYSIHFVIHAMYLHILYMPYFFYFRQGLGPTVNIFKIEKE